jgi:hypothetical protein
LRDKAKINNNLASSISLTIKCVYYFATLSDKVNNSWTLFVICITVLVKLYSLWDKNYTLTLTWTDKAVS